MWNKIDSYIENKIETLSVFWLSIACSIAMLLFGSVISVICGIFIFFFSGKALFLLLGLMFIFAMGTGMAKSLKKDIG